MLNDYKRIVAVLLLISLVLLGIAFTQKDKLPSKDLILPSLLNEPIQKETPDVPFSLTFKQETYDIKPLYEYELYGMVVSYHHSNSWNDITHAESNDFLNIEDLCVIYGENISSNVYQHMKFQSGDWTCYPEFNRSTYRKFGNKFKIHYLSNNHMLSDNPELIERIMSVKKGDQIYFKGYLVNYGNQRWLPFTRNSSTVRDDHGCEVVYVTDFQVLNRANKLWRFIYSMSFGAVFVFLGFYMFLLFLEAKAMLDRHSNRS